MFALPCLDWRGALRMQLMAHAFFDDADTTHQGASVLIMAGFVAGDAQWQTCSAKWRQRLSLAGLSHMHTADFLSGNGEVRPLQMTKEAREDLARHLLDILADNLSFGVAIGVDHQCMKALLGRLPKPARPTPYSFVITRLFWRCLDQMRAQGYDGPLYPTFDDSEREAQGILGAYHLALRQNPRLRGEIAAICFADDRHVVSVQAADLLAGAALRRWRANPETDSADLLHHLAQRCPFVSELWDAEEIGRREQELLSALSAPAGPKSRQKPPAQTARPSHLRQAGDDGYEKYNIGAKSPAPGRSGTGQEKQTADPVEEPAAQNFEQQRDPPSESDALLEPN